MRRLAHNRIPFKQETNTFGVVSLYEIEPKPVGSKNKLKRQVVVKCKCGIEFPIIKENFRRQKMCSECKGKLLGARSFKHGLSKTPEYKSKISKSESRKESLKKYRQSEIGKINRKRYDHERRQKIGGRIKVETIKNVILKSRSKCHWCEKELNMNERYSWHLDHVLPVSKGGGNDEENLVVSCPKCNRTKANKHPDDFRKILDERIR